MNTKSIEDKYSLFNIPKENVPKYQNPYKFANQFHKCSILKDSNIQYSDSTNLQKK